MGEIAVSGARQTPIEEALKVTEELLKAVLSGTTDSQRADQVLTLAADIFGAALVTELRRVNPALALLEKEIWNVIDPALQEFFQPRVADLLREMHL